MGDPNFSVRCPSAITSNCAEGVFYNDDITDLGANNVQEAIEALAGGAQGAGAQGAVGAQGAQGSGAQGAVGAQGVGTQGAQGSGAQGAQGAAGAQGSGAQGAQGSGAQGSAGTQGAQGASGAQGSGTQGSTGPQGAQGSTQSDQGSVANRIGMQGVLNNVQTIVAYNTIISNPQGNYNVNGLYTAQLTGFYSFSASVVWDVLVAPGTRIMFLFLNGVAGTLVSQSNLRNVVTIGAVYHTIACNFFPMTAGDTMQVNVIQIGNASEDIGVLGGAANQFCVAYLGT